MMARTIATATTTYTAPPDVGGGREEGAIDSGMGRYLGFSGDPTAELFETDPLRGSEGKILREREEAKEHPSIQKRILA
jgi:hypothetical protein